MLLQDDLCIFLIETRHCFVSKWINPYTRPSF